MSRSPTPEETDGAAPRRVLVGTAGHVDHGKTRLVEALTGIDCDRWEEEKRRGITIDLGFAHLEGDGVQVGFVDVPGHERFLHNALAGLGGVRALLLIVAADEGVMPQTREHVAICSLLDIPAALVALTKVDLVDSDVVEVVREEVAELLETTPWPGAPALAVSSVTNDGVDELRQRLLALARRHAVDTDARPARLPVDRAFGLKGRGLVVTGTLAHGVVAEGDELSLAPGDLPVRVRALQVHGRDRQNVATGERVAAQIAGVPANRVERGSELLAPGSWATTTRLLAEVTVLSEAGVALDRSTAVRVHLYASAVEGKVRPLAEPIQPGGRGAVEVRLVRPLVAARGDRLILRRLTPIETLGGGRVLDPVGKRRRSAERPAAIEALLGTDGDAVRLWIGEAGDAGLEAADIARRLGVTAEDAAARLAEAGEDGSVLRLPAGAGHGARWVAAGVPARIARRATAVLEAFAAENRLAAGMPRAEAVARILPGRAAELADIYLPWLARENRMRLEADRVRLPGGGARLDEAEASLAERLVARYDAAGLEPPPPKQVAGELGAKPQIVEGVVRYLIDEGRLARLPGGLVIAASAIDTVVERIRAEGWERFDVPRFKETFGLTRKWAIPLLEALDGRNVTRRVGNERIVLPPR